MADEEWIYPWKLNELVKRGEEPLYREIRDDLVSLYPVLSQMQLPSKEVLTALDTLLDKIRGLREEQKVPWLLVASNRPMLLGFLAVMLPTVLAASYKLKPKNTNSDKLIHMFRSPLPADDFMADPAGEELHRIVRAGILVWENFNEERYNSRGYATKFAEFLIERLTYKRITIFLCIHDGEFKAGTGQFLLNEIDSIYGKTVAAMIKTDTVKKSLYMKDPDPKFETTRILL